MSQNVMSQSDMALTRQAEDAIENEFAAYYQADELPADDAVLRQHLPAHTAASADRLGRGAPDLVAVLERVAADPRDPLFERLSAVTLLEWRDEDLWPIFQEIVTQIARRLQPTGA